MRKTFFAFAALLVLKALYSEPVKLETAITVAYNWLNHQNEIRERTHDITLRDSYTHAEEDQVFFYVFNFEPEGFVIVAGDDASYPVLGYNVQGIGTIEEVPPNTASLFSKYEESIREIRSKQLSNEKTILEWDAVINDEISVPRDFRTVEPLLSTQWRQIYPWNQDCPEDPAGPGGHVSVGCVAVAMAQVVKHWNFPYQGTGSHTYYHPTYGWLSANFGETTYNWANMPNNAATSSTSLLLYHLGVSVEMYYGPHSSGAYSGFVRDALVGFFGYHPEAQYLSRSNYTNVQWISMLKNQLDNNMPLYYSGFGTGGHVFNCDGYDANDNFHFNWGWGGVLDGFYHIDNLNPGNSQYNNNQAAIFDLTPAPPPPRNLTAEIGDDIVFLSWEAPAEPGSFSSIERSTLEQTINGVTRLEFLGYNVYRNGLMINSELVLNTEYDDTDVMQGSSYQYYVTAVYDEDESLPSYAAIINFIPTITNPPQNVAMSITDESVILTWEEVISADYYKVYSSVEPGGIFEEDDTGLFDDTSWTVQVTEEKKFYYLTTVSDAVYEYEWCLVPAGDYTYGSGNTIMSIDYDYEIMKYEVTNAQYLTYLQEAYAAGDIWVGISGHVQGYYPGDEHWGAGNRVFYELGTPSGYNFAQISFSNGVFKMDAPSGFTIDDYLNHPVVMITWFGAWHFAQYYGWRLPTEHEWEKAARGMTGHLFPWGNTVNGSRANYSNSGDHWDNGTTPVGFYNGQVYQGFQTIDSPSPFGVYDLAGNVFNWTDSFSSSTSISRVLRGGSWGNYTGNLASWARFYHSNPTGLSNLHGFRCVRNQ